MSDKSTGDPVVPIRKLIEQHARAWAAAGTSNSGLVIDPAADYHLEEARRLSRLLEERFNQASALPNSIVEALNSGDGVYRP